MKVKPLLAVLSVCAAAGVVTWDVKYFDVRAAPTHGPSVPSAANPATTSNASSTLGGTASTPSGASSTPITAVGASAPAARPADASDDDAAATTTRSSEPDFDKLFEQLLKQNALRSQVDGARDGVGLPATPDVSGATTTADGWDRLELRGVLCGSDRAIALVNGRMLQVGDELPLVRYRITKILADRVIATSPIGGLERALTLHVFESPSRKVAPAVSAGSSAPASTAPTNGTNPTNSAAPASPAPPAGTGSTNAGGTSSGSQPASGGNHGANR